MLFPVCLSAAGEKYRVVVPDIPGCEVVDDDRQRAITKAHLRIEGVISQLLIDGAALPETSAIREVRERPEYASAEVYEIHINTVHLSAVARHQAGR